MKESKCLTFLEKLENSDDWGFGDGLELLCFYTQVLANAFDSGREGFEKIDTALRDVWTTIEDSISDGKIRVKSGRLIDLSSGLMLTKNPNILVMDKNSFLSWYRRDKEKVAQYLSYAGLAIYHEKFLDRLAKIEPAKNHRLLTDKEKRNRLRKNYISSATKKLKHNSSIHFSDFRNDYDLQKLIRASGLPKDKRPKDSTLQTWIRDVRKNLR